MITCTAITHDGTRCQRNATSDGRCPWHGGKPLPGKWSREIPEYLRARYDTACADPQPLSLHDELALLDTRISDLLTQIQTNGPRDYLQQLRHTFQTLEAEQDRAKQKRLLKKLRQITTQARTEQIVWDNIRALIEQRRLLIKAHHHQALLTKDLLTQHEAVRLLDALTEALHRHITDPAILTAFHTDAANITKGLFK